MIHLRKPSVSMAIFRSTVAQISAVIFLVLHSCLLVTAQDNSDEASRKLTEMLAIRQALVATHNESQLSTEEVIDSIKHLIDTDLSILKGLRSGDQAFLADLPNVNVDLAIEEHYNALRKNRYQLSQRYQELNQYAQSVALLEQIVLDGKALEKLTEWQLREFKLRLQVAQWLLNANDTQRLKWKASKQAATTALAAFKAEKWDLVISNYKAAAEALQELKLTETMDYGEAVANLAEALFRNRDLEAAVPSFEHAIQVNDELFEKQSLTNANMRRSMAGLYRARGEYELALTLITEAEQIYANVGASPSLDLALNLYFKGLALESLSRNDLATRTFMTAEQMLREIGEKNLKLTWMAQQEICKLFQQSMASNGAQLGPAEQARQQAAKIFGNDTSAIAHWLCILGDAYFIGEQREFAIEIYDQARLSFEALQDPRKRPAHLDCLMKLAKCHYQTGNVEEAIVSANLATELASAHYGVNSLSYALPAQNLATYQSLAGNYDQAEEILAKLLPSLEVILGPQHVEFARVTNDRASNLAKAGNWDRAIEVWLKVKQTQFNHPDVPKSEYIQTLKNLIDGYMRQGDQVSVLRLQKELSQVESDAGK